MSNDLMDDLFADVLQPMPDQTAAPHDAGAGTAVAVPPPDEPPVAEPVVELPEGAVSITEFAERAYLAYAMSVVRSRALPQIEDGQKPVQKRILYAMREMGNRHDAPFKKSARIVGDVIGKYHPHGDVAVYEAAVRMAQDFTLRYPLIEGQGNFGSRDGDGAAAMRYTEIRLTPFAEEILLAELDKGTVAFRDNYDGSMQEPEFLPARLPVLLLNGAQGIAVGMATSMPPHNLREIVAACVQIVRGESPDLSAIAPDFPGGGQIISATEDIDKAYATGRGSVRVRARWAVEPLARGQYRIAVTELPPDTSTAKVLSEIEELTNPKPKSGKKTLSPEQAALKANVLAVLDSARDDSDQAHPVRLVLEPRSSRVTPEELMQVLLANTSLEGNVSINLVLIRRDGRPQQTGLADILDEWCRFRVDTVGRRLRHRKGEVERRIHILDGRMVVFLNIDRVIAVIRESDAPKADLMAAFSLTETQAEDILEIRLRQLAKLEGIKIERELKALRAELGELDALLGNEEKLRQLVANELEADAAKFGDVRRTLVEVAEKITASAVDTLVDEPVTLLLSRNGFVRLRSGHGIDPNAVSWKQGDGPFAIIETRTVHPIALLASNGRVFSLRAAELPGGKGDGAPLSSFIDLGGTAVVGVVSAPAERRVLIANADGYGFVCAVGDLATRQKAGKAFVAVDEGQSLLPMTLLPPDSTELATLSVDGALLVQTLDEVKMLSGGGKGVILMGLRGKAKLLAVAGIHGRLTVLAIGRADKDVTAEIAGAGLDPYRGKRARMGRMLDLKFKRLVGLG